MSGGNQMTKTVKYALNLSFSVCDERAYVWERHLRRMKERPAPTLTSQTLRLTPKSHIAVWVISTCNFTLRSPPGDRSKYFHCAQASSRLKREGGGKERKRTRIKCSSGVREGVYQTSSVCVYLCCRPKRTQGSSVEACSSFC